MGRSALEKWFYPHAKRVRLAVLGEEKEWEGRVPILVEDAWNHQQDKINSLNQYIGKLISKINQQDCGKNTIRIK